MTMMGAVAVLSATLVTPAVVATGPLAAVASGSAVKSAAAAPKTPTFRTVDDQADPTFNQLLGINDQGAIAGYFGSGAPGHPNRGYVVGPPYAQDNYRNENFPGSAQTQVVGINNNGYTVGFWVDAGGNNFGFVEHNGAFTKVANPLTTTANFNQLLGINDRGVAVGFYNDAQGVAHGYTYTVSTKAFRAVKIRGAGSVTATGINNRGDISGFYTVGKATFGFLLAQGRFQRLSFGNKSNTQALGVNKADKVVGSYVDGAGVLHGFIWSKGLTTIDDPNANRSSGNGTVVNGLNNRGQLVGFFVDAAGNTNGMLVTGRF